jgi:hypothetical protein
MQSFLRIDRAAITTAFDRLAIILLVIGITAAPIGATPAAPSTTSYTVVDTGQVKCYDNSKVIQCPRTGEILYGQDAQYAGNLPRYRVSEDALTVYDENSKLTWQRSPDTNGDGLITITDKLSWTKAQTRPATLNNPHYGGYSDWRLPTIKELYSLIDFRGTDPNPTAAGFSGLTPFIDTSVFKFAYGQTGSGERIIDSQYASSNLYVGRTFSNEGGKLFGVNFADGRIKGYGLTLQGTDKTFFVICVRGNPEYGINHLVDNGDQTITDQSTGLMWAKTDSGTGMNWEAALAWIQSRNSQNYLGHNDWRLPNAKELQSIVDYTRSPDSTNSAAINPLFDSTRITNEAGQTDFPFYWTGTTHATSDGSGSAAVYISFGRAMGYMNGAWADVHGAGAQRSDPKNGKLADYPTGRGPQGDAIRIYNYVRPVRGGLEGSAYTESTATSPVLELQPTLTLATVLTIAVIMFSLRRLRIYPT